MKNQALSPIQITERAAARIRALVSNEPSSPIGLRLGTANRGCSGITYTLDFVDPPDPLDEIVDVGGIPLYIDPKSLIYILGTEMDYVEDGFSTGFVFNNPNARGECGCGESFHL